jgi:DNA-binding response OmpR family regulator
MAKWNALVIAEANTLGFHISTLLKKEDFNVTVVDSFGPGSIEAVYREISVKRYDLILPTNNGLTPSKILELIPEIRKRDHDVRIIVLSGHHPADFMRELGEKDIDGFLPMPFRSEDLVQKVKESLIRSGSSQKESKGRRIEMAGDAKNQEIILQMVGAGIMVTLYGVRVKGDKWKFFLNKDEGTMTDFLLEEDADLLPTLRTKSEYADTWDKALALLDRYPWTRFVPGEVHPEFRNLVWSAVQSRKTRRPERAELDPYEEWRRLLQFNAPNKDERRRS